MVLGLGKRKRGAKAKPESLGEAAVIEGVIRHAPCGWVSDGGAFREGAGCPRCGARIFEGECEEVTESELVEEEDDDGEEEDEEEEFDEEDEDLEDEEEGEYEE